LQDDVTSDKEAGWDRRGGFGMMSVLDFVEAIADSDRTQHMVLVSGSSCVHMKGVYRVGTKSEGGCRVQWFNREQEPGKVPDPQYVLDLKRSFPGTAVSIGFTVDPEFLRETIRSSADD